jgi:hypothetical protein
LGVAQRSYRVRKVPLYDAACFHCHQCIEKYLKAKLNEAGIFFTKTHNLTFGIMPLLLAWELIYFLPLRRPLVTFTGFWLTEVYDIFISTPESYQYDHPFPPLTVLQANLVGGGTLLVSLFPIWILRKRGLWKFGQRLNTQ